MSIEEAEISERVRKAAVEIEALTTRSQGSGHLSAAIAQKWNIHGHDLLTLMDEVNALGRQRVERIMQQENILEPVATFIRIKGRIQNELPLLKLRIRSGDWNK